MFLRRNPFGCPCASSQFDSLSVCKSVSQMRVGEPNDYPRTYLMHGSLLVGIEPDPKHKNRFVLELYFEMRRTLG